MSQRRTSFSCQLGYKATRTECVFFYYPSFSTLKNQSILENFLKCNFMWSRKNQIRQQTQKTLFYDSQCIFIYYSQSNSNKMSDSQKISCQIFGVVGVIVQIFLGALSFSVLIIKRYKQHPKRRWRIWALDTSKQGVSQLIAHFINVGISLLLSTHLENDACIWYFTTNVLDNTVGVFFCCGCLRLIESTLIADRCQQFRSGNYYQIVEYNDQYMSTYQQSVTRDSGNQKSLDMKPLEITTKKQIVIISYFAWVIQFLIWNLIVAVCKSLVFMFQFFLNKPISTISQFLIGWVQPYPNLQLVLVIIIIPVVMNGLAFWIQDNYLKKGEVTSLQNNPGTQTMKEPLM